LRERERSLLSISGKDSCHRSSRPRGRADGAADTVHANSPPPHVIHDDDQNIRRAAGFGFESGHRFAGDSFLLLVGMAGSK
jgi:hypothetical protein